jgi:hypothetical protein
MEVAAKAETSPAEIANQAVAAKQGAAGSDTVPDPVEDEEGATCAICSEQIRGTTTPCTNLPTHKFCQSCADAMRKNELSPCNLCQPAVGADLFFYQSMQRRLQASRCSDAKRKEELQAEAFGFLKQALEADSQHIKAQNNLGFLYEKGEGVAQDYAQAAIFYCQAAEQGEADAQLNLGLQYFGGHGVDETKGTNMEQAAIWIKKAAAQGHKQAQRICEQMQF